MKKHDDVYYGAPYTREDMLRNCETQEEAYGIIEEAFATDGSGIRRICQQAARKQLDLFPEDGEKSRYKCWTEPMYCWWRTVMMRSRP